MCVTVVRWLGLALVPGYAARLPALHFVFTDQPPVRRVVSDEYLGIEAVALFVNVLPNFFEGGRGKTLFGFPYLFYWFMVIGYWFLV